MKHVLIVDDSPTMRRMIQASLQSFGNMHFHQASNGLEALEQLALVPMDVMILDLNMPDMHGLDVLRFVRRHQTYRTLPVIVLTTRGDDTSRNDALAAGASLYLTKPFAPHTLAAQMREFLS